MADLNLTSSPLASFFILARVCYRGAFKPARSARVCAPCVLSVHSNALRLGVGDHLVDVIRAPYEPKKLHRFQRLAAELKVVLPISWFERANYAYYNSLCMIDADGSVFPNVYRKSHIPDGE